MKVKNKKTIVHPSVTSQNSLKRILFKDFYILFSYPVLALYFVVIWFHDRLLLTTAEQGLHLLNPIKTLSVYRNIWLEIGLGISSPFYIPRIPYYTVLSFFSALGISNWFIQATVYWLVLCVGLLAVTFLVTNLNQKQVRYLPYITAILYLCNLFVLSQVLIRFLDALLFLWAFLPLFLLFWVRWIKQNRIFDLLGLLISTFIFSSVFTLISSLFLIWVPSALYVLVILPKARNKKKILLTAGIGGICWLITNAWWLLPIWIFKNNSYSEFANISSSLGSLVGVSKYYPLSELFLLRQSFFFGEHGPWAVFYLDQKYYIISYVMLFFCFIGIIFSIRQRKNYYFAALFLLGFFLVKGTNPPFGYVFYKFLFEYLPITQVLRNPYEKLGLLFVLPYVFFVSLGVLVCAEKMKRIKILLIPVFLIIACIVLVRPLWRKDLFPSEYRVQVPQYYAQANDYIRSKTTNRIFHLPYQQDSTVVYDWRYRGEEPSEFLFDNISLAKMSHIPSVDMYYVALQDFLQHKNFPKLLQMVNIDTIILHNEYKTEPNRPDFKEQSLSYIKKWNGKGQKSTIGALDIYFLDSSKIPGTIYTVESLLPVQSIHQGFDDVLDKNFNIQSSVFIVRSDIPKEQKILLESIQKQPISFKKISNQHYRVHITHAVKPFVLVFSMNFNPRWQAKSGDTVFTNHFKTNGYANTWLVEKKGTYDIDIEFKSW